MITDVGNSTSHLDPDDDFADMACRAEILEGRRKIGHLEFLIDDRVDAEVLDHANHALEHLYRSENNTVNVQGLGRELSMSTDFPANA
jgi:hypothetical protein